jgi:hypothetical protein
MKTNRKPSIEPSNKFKKELEWALANQESLDVDGITITPPKGKKTNWRLRVSIDGRLKERSGGTEFGIVNAAFIEMKMLKERSERGQQGLPENGHMPLQGALETYLIQRGPTSDWKYRTEKNRREDFRHLLIIAKDNKLQCSELNSRWLREYLANATASAIRAKTLEGALRTFVSWGFNAGYFDKEQVELAKQARWQPPIGSKYSKQPNRRQQSREYFGDDEQDGGEVPTHEQVQILASECQRRYKYGEGLIHTAANLGTRAAETMLLTASASIAKQGLGNLVDLEENVARIKCQVNDDPDIKSKSTKNGKRRAVVIPLQENVGTGFDLREWLRIRCAQALQEQDRGLNPLALIFPTQKGDIYSPESINSVVIRPSTDALGWRMPAYVDAKGKSRTLSRFTLHSMRDRFGLTAAEEWGYSQIQLLQQGSWADLATIQKFYIGITDETQKSVLNKHSKPIGTYVPKRQSK